MSPSNSATIAPKELEELCADARRAQGVVGAQVALAIGDDLISASDGLANAALDELVTERTLFQIGSTTKLYTAVLAMQLVESGRLKLDEPVTSQALRGTRLSMSPESGSITPRQLMAMTSGLDNGPYIDTGRNDDCVERYVNLLDEIPLISEPGANYGYSNASTVVSGLAVERLTGAIWDDALREGLLQPAGLQHSVSLFEELPYHPVAVGHVDTTHGTQVVAGPWCFSRGAGPAGTSLAASAEDLARFGSIFLRGGLANDGTRILSAESVDVMQSRQIDVPSRCFADAWCVGPYAKDWGKVEVFGHSGTNVNGSSTLVWVPELGIVVATVVNSPQRGYGFADAVLDVVFRDWLGVAKPSRPEPLSSPPAGLAAYEGRYRSYGITYDVTVRDHALSLSVESETPRYLSGRRVTSELLPLGDHRFLPADDAVTDHHRWDIAFSLDAAGDVNILHNGALAARREMAHGTPAQDARTDGRG